MHALIDSLIRARGQQTPIEVVDLGDGRYGLISGWRRLRALRGLLAETGEARFATVQALLRRPDGASDAYVAMVEENEIRVGLGHYERARIVARAVEQGVYPEPKAGPAAISFDRQPRQAIQDRLVSHRLSGASTAPPFPRRPDRERLGLALAQALEADRALADRIKGGAGQGRPCDRGRRTGTSASAPRRIRRASPPLSGLRMPGTCPRRLASGRAGTARRALHPVWPGRWTPLLARVWRTGWPRGDRNEMFRARNISSHLPEI